MDAIYLCVFTVLFALSIVWKSDVTFYPVIQMNLTSLNYISVIAFTVLTVLPFVLEVKEALKWKTITKTLQMWTAQMKIL